MSLLRSALTLLLLTPAHAAAQAGPAPSFITPASLAASLDRPELVVLHVGDKDGYAAAHVADARHVELSMITAPAQPGLQNELPPPAELEAKLEALGIGDGSRVVVYFAKDDLAQVAQAARVVFTLDYAGLAGRTAILDGGLPAWVREGRPTTTDVPAVTPGTLTVRPTPSALVDLAWMREHGSRAQLLDARPRPFYTGDDDRNGELKRPGHIPGAVSVPFGSFFNEDKTLKSKDALEKMLTDAGITKGTPVVTYCHSGVQATVPYVVARMLGYDVRVYDASYQQWSASDAPVVKGASPR